LVRELVVHIDDELEKEMSAHPEVDWVKVVIKAIRDCIRCRENCKFYDTIIDRAMSEERKERARARFKPPNKKSQKLRALRPE
jgi:hypothetical protein